MNRYFPEKFIGEPKYTGSKVKGKYRKEVQKEWSEYESYVIDKARASDMRNPEDVADLLEATGDLIVQGEAGDLSEEAMAQAGLLFLETIKAMAVKMKIELHNGECTYGQQYMAGLFFMHCFNKHLDPIMRRSIEDQFENLLEQSKEIYELFDQKEIDQASDEEE